jgi:tetratricopeptide (TPR) repeat protein
MFILETLRALLGRRAGAPLTPEPPQAGMLPLPADVGQLIERRLQQLSPAALDLARVAALAGPDFSPELAGKVLERRVVDLVQPWQELEAAQVIRDQAFAHDLVLEATQRSVPQAVARALHRAIGQLLAAAPGTQAAERCAEHLWLAGDWAAAAAQFEAAAAQAKAASLPAREAALWQRAIEAHERAGQAAQAHQAGMQSVDALLLTGSATRALEFTDRLVQQARSSAQRLRALLLRAYARLLTNQTGPALVDSENALAQARAARDEECEFDAARMLGMSLALSRRAPEGATLLESYAGYALRHPSERQRYKYWSDYAYVLQYTSRRHECLDALLKAVALAEGLGEQAELMTTLTNAANVCSTLGRYDQTISLSLRAVSLNERLGTAGGTAGGATLLNLAAASAATGRYERALALFEQADAAFASAENDAYRFAGENHLASMYLHLGQPARALQTLRTAPEAAQGSSRLRRLLLRARIARFLGQPDQDWMRQAQAAAAQSHEMSMGLLLDLDAAMALPAAAAAARIEEVAEQAQAHEYEAIALRARLLRIEAGLRDGATPVPPAELDAVAAQLESRQPMDTYLPEAHWIVARAWAGRGEARQATASLELAHRWIIETALPHVPQPMRESFLQRNPVNRAVLARIEAGPLTSQ